MNDDNRQYGASPETLNNGISGDSFVVSNTSGSDITLPPSSDGMGGSGATSNVPPSGGANPPGQDTQNEQEKGLSIITYDTTVTGSIATKGHIDVVGRVNGDVVAQGEIAIRGTIKGYVEGQKIGLYNCRVRGDIKAGQGIVADSNSIVGGNLVAQNIMLDCKVKGNVDADNVVVLRNNSFCLGNVTTRSLAVEPGAVLNGYVRTMVSGDAESAFNELN